MAATRAFANRPKQKKIERWNIVRDDIVEVISGKDTGKQGQVMKVLRKKNEVLVKGVNQSKPFSSTQSSRESKTKKETGKRKSS